MGDLFASYDILGAFWMTIKLAFFSAIGALVLGTIAAVLRLSPAPFMRFLGATYVNIVRNTPLTLICLFCVLALRVQLGINIVDPRSATAIMDANFRWALIALSVYHGTFVCEALRSGVNTVPVGQAEAARSLGLTFTQTLGTVILPQAFRGAITPLGNTLIALTKNTTVVAVIGVGEIAYLMATMSENDPNQILWIFVTVALGFVILTLPMGLATTWLGRRLVVQR